MVCGPEGKMRYMASSLRDAGVPEERIYFSMERNMKCAMGILRPLPVRPRIYLQGWPGPAVRPHLTHPRRQGDLTLGRLTWRRKTARSSRFGSLHPATDANFRCSTWRTSFCARRRKSTSRISLKRRAISDGPYDLSLVEGSITTTHDAERIHKVREQSKFLVTIGACATSGGIQALRNFADVNELHFHRFCLPAIYRHALDIDADQMRMCGWISNCRVARSTSCNSPR